MLNLYCYKKKSLFTVKYVIDSIYFIREVTLTYFLTLPQFHSPKTLYLFNENALYYGILDYYHPDEKNVCKCSFMMANIFLQGEHEMELLNFPKNLGDTYLYLL